MKKIELSILALTQTQPPNGFYTLILKEVEGNRQLSITIGLSEAESIALGLEKVPIARPMTHDVIKHLLDEFKLALRDILIYNLDETNMVYSAFINIQKELDVIELDTRPSDAIALAVRLNAPIYVYDSIITRSSAIINTVSEMTEQQANETKPISLLSLDELNHKLKEAVETESYEQAIKIRDEINSRIQSEDK